MMVRIDCQSCHKPFQVDETKLPNGPVTFPCPHCKSPLTVDRKNLTAPAPAPASPAPVVPAQAAPLQEHDDHEFHQLGEKAMIVGTDSAVLRQAAKSIGLHPVFIADPQQARDYFVREYPPVVFFNPAQITAPPLADFVSLTSVSPLDRRKGFFILVADNLRTLDGNAAFLYGMNLCVASKDINSFPQIYAEADAFHKRLYASINAVHSRH